MGMALEHSSTTAYNSHLNSYLTFCCIHDRPIAPSVDTLSFFIVYMSTHICPNSIAVYLTGVCNIVIARTSIAQGQEGSVILVETY